MNAAERGSQQSMNGALSTPESSLEIDLGDLDLDEAANLEIVPGGDLITYIPLDSIGVTNSHVDIGDDLLEAIWSAERLAANAAEAVALRDYPTGTHKTRLKLILRDTGAGLPAAIRERAVLYNRYDELDQQFGQTYSDTRDAVLDFEDTLDTLVASLPEIVDDYFANLVGGAYHQMRYDAPDRYESEMSKYPDAGSGTGGARSVTGLVHHAMRHPTDGFWTEPSMSTIFSARPARSSDWPSCFPQMC